MIEKFTRKESDFEIDNETAGAELEATLRHMLQLSEGARPDELAARIAAMLQPEFTTPPHRTDEDRSPSRLETLVTREQAAHAEPVRRPAAKAKPRREAAPEPARQAEPASAYEEAPDATFESARAHPQSSRSMAEAQPAPAQPHAPAPVQQPHVQAQAPVQAPVHAQAPAQAAHRQPAPAEPQHSVPSDFVVADEHPMFSVPFTLTVGGRVFEGHSLSLTHLVVSGDGAGGLDLRGAQIARLQIHFDGFDLSLQPEVAVSETHADGAMTLYFTNPTGAHLPQLRYVLNNTISGDVTTLNGLLCYTGPTSARAPKAPAPPATMSQRVRSMAVMAVSGLLMLAAAVALYSRYTTGVEMHPVFVERGGQQMRASAAGQVAYLNPEAGEGDVIFTVNANTGDVLNFMLPCDCEFAISPEISEGSTVLPSDLMLTIFGINSDIRAKTMLSVEGLARVMEGDRVILDMSDGRSIPVEVSITQATSTAAMSGALFVPVQLKTPDGVLSAEDVGKSGRLRITSSVLARFGLS